MKRLFVAVTATLLLGAGRLFWRSLRPAHPRPRSPPPQAASPNAPNPSASSPATPDAKCLDGRYRLVRFVGVGEKGTYGTGEGGDVTVTFDNGSYLLRGAGKDPIKLTLAGQTADLLVNGTVSGDYQCGRETGRPSRSARAPARRRSASAP